MEDKRENTPIEETNEGGRMEYDASFEPDTIEVMSDDELQDTILADSNMSGFQRWIAKLDDQKWKLYQTILGIVLAAASCTALFWRGSNDTENAFSWSLVIAVIIALVVPNIIEKKGLRRIPRTRNTMAIAMGVIIVGYFLVLGIRTGFNFTGA